MGSITEFLKHVPDAASSPLAFVAYVLVVAAWLVAIWLRNNPERKAQQILKQFTDDDARLKALNSILHNAPPRGLVGSADIITWVKESNKGRRRLLLVVAWGITLVAIIVFSVAVKNSSAQGQKQLTVSFHRQGTTADCPALPTQAHLELYVSGKKFDNSRVVEGCTAMFTMQPGERRAATLILADAPHYALADPTVSYQLGLGHWDVYLTDSDQKSRLRISLFEYGGPCNTHSNSYSTFRGILQTKVNSLRGIFASDDHRYDYLSEVHIVPAGKVLDLSNDEIQNYWATTSSLQVLSGLCFNKGGLQFMQSQVFSARFSGDLPEPFVAELPLTASEFGTTRDIHTLSLLYALSQEARSRGLEKDVVISYLSHAREIALQIGGSRGQQITHSIDLTLQKNGAPAPLVLSR